MNKIRRAKGIAEFVLLTTPAIALVLFGIQQMLQPVPTETRYPAPGTPPAIEVAKDQRHVAMIDKRFPVADGFKHVDKIVWNHMQGGYHCPDNIDSSINDLGVAFPKNMPIQEIDANLRAIARELFEEGAKYVTISAFSGDPTGDAPYPEEVAHLIFAPYGDLRKTDRLYHLDEYKAVIKHKSSLQQPKQKVPVLIRIVDGATGKQGIEEKN